MTASSLSSDVSSSERVPSSVSVGGMMVSGESSPTFSKHDFTAEVDFFDFPAVRLEKQMRRSVVKN